MCESPVKAKVKAPIKEKNKVLESIKVTCITPSMCTVRECTNNADILINMGYDKIKTCLCYECAVELTRNLLEHIDECDLEEVY